MMFEFKKKYEVTFLYESIRLYIIVYECILPLLLLYNVVYWVYNIVYHVVKYFGESKI